jgi:hypothetical protein
MQWITEPPSRRIIPTLNDSTHMLKRVPKVNPSLSVHILQEWNVIYWNILKCHIFKSSCWHPPTLRKSRGTLSPRAADDELKGNLIYPAAAVPCPSREIERASSYFSHYIFYALRYFGKGRPPARPPAHPFHSPPLTLPPPPLSANEGERLINQQTREISSNYAFKLLRLVC